MPSASVTLNAEAQIKKDRINVEIQNIGLTVRSIMTRCDKREKLTFELEERLKQVTKVCDGFISHAKEVQEQGGDAQNAWDRVNIMQDELRAIKKQAETEHALHNADMDQCEKWEKKLQELTDALDNLEKFGETGANAGTIDNRDNENGCEERQEQVLM